MVNKADVIKLSDVTLTLESGAGPVNILKGINFAISEGQSVGIVGPSGSGKSSLMSLMTGLEQATTGDVVVDDLSFTGADEDTLARHRLSRVGIVMQAFHLIPTMTALENVAVPLELAGKNDAFEIAAKELELVGLAHRMDHYPTQLSGGEQQRVALARALAPQPAILFGDEPTGNLDGKTGRAVIDLIFELAKERGSTLVIVTHDPALADRCDRVISMADGNIIDDTGDTSSVSGTTDAVREVAQS
ncbi:ABC transporter ATP-binding protein [Kordiimonas sp. SCSIO 12603]|uniref:ABC transporter ATP-binding protein n=1 Tax=Kordiimonas sp. SCSIO 12603 TaxID=2829596 RepID=UPI002106715D|nr:ABC transporter ATP-binding protein [Kordiimonas sp. SCSIO 12603]UTW58542.1 ABC transporter ATP-binding protein [Kordiimonas sp. SCSIO 12603]